MATRVEFYRPVSVAGRESQLYVSSGPSDDYLEISLPQDVDPNSSTLCGLRDLPNTNNDLSVDFYDGDPALISVTALYINDPRRKSSSSKERVAEILSNLVRVAPILDFGDLLPKRIEAVESPVVEASVAPAALSQEAEAPVITSPARDEVQATARRAARAEKMRRVHDFVARAGSQGLTHLRRSASRVAKPSRGGGPRCGAKAAGQA